MGLTLSDGYFSDRSQEIGMAEVMVAADSELIGHTVVEAETAHPLRADRDRLATRSGDPRGSRYSTEKLRIGDTLLVVGRWKDIERLRTGRG